MVKIQLPSRPVQTRPRMHSLDELTLVANYNEAYIMHTIDKLVRTFRIYVLDKEL